MMNVHRERAKEKPPRHCALTVLISQLAKKEGRKENIMDAQKIKTERLQLGISQQKMAERLGVTARTIRNYESGETHVPDTVTKLHNCLKRNDMIKREGKLNG